MSLLLRVTVNPPLGAARSKATVTTVIAPLRMAVDAGYTEFRASGLTVTTVDMDCPIKLAVIADYGARRYQLRTADNNYELPPIITSATLGTATSLRNEKMLPVMPSSCQLSIRLRNVNRRKIGNHYRLVGMPRLMLFGFENQENVTGCSNGDSESVCLWRPDGFMTRLTRHNHSLRDMHLYPLRC